MMQLCSWFENTYLNIFQVDCAPGIVYGAVAGTPSRGDLPGDSPVE